MSIYIPIDARGKKTSTVKRKINSFKRKSDLNSRDRPATGYETNPRTGMSRKKR